MFALLLVPLLLMVGLAVDVGSWYNRASDIQKAADAASLAGVVWLPDEGKARSVALETAKKNGFDNADPDITVSAVRSTKSARRLKVTIRDRRVGSFFYEGISGRTVDMTRNSFAEFVTPVPLGSPDNRFGNDPDHSPRPNFWAAINGPYMDYKSGDPYSTKCIHPGSVTSCNSQGANDEYRDSGYYYAIEVSAAGKGKPLKVELYDPTFTNAGSNAGDGPQVFQATSQRVSFEFFEADNTELDHTDNPSMSGRCNSGPGKKIFSQNENAGKNRWYNLCTISSAKEGIYVMQVKSGNITGYSDNGTGNNAYSVRATSSSGNQPKLYGIGDMSIFTNSAGSVAEFYLAEIKGVHAGKILEIALFDPGDGSSGNYDLSILRPGGAVSQCTYTNEYGTMGSLGACKIRTRDASRNPANKYDAKWLTIRVPLPANYTCDETTATGCWWKVKYDFGTGSPTDRTTWSARILGDPVHLIEEH